MPNMAIKIKNISLGRSYSLGEEIANSVTHGFGTILSVVGLVLLVYLATINGDGYQIVSFSIYGASLIILYLASTLYHAFQKPKLKRVFKIIDHASIFLLIAGTYTPFLLVGLRGRFGWILFAIIWGLALMGIGFKAFFIDRFQKLSTLAYVLMGWLSVLMIKGLAENIEMGGLIWLAVGGVAYTVGVIFYALKKIPYMHSIWHLFVLAGSVSHFMSVYLFLAPHS
jgi:hemolysin III